MNNQILAPIAKKNRIVIENFEDKKVDLYDWLRDKDYPNVNNKEILNYLKSENNYANYELTKDLDLIDEIYREMISRIKEDDETVPIKIGNYYYYSYIKKGMDYWIHSRRYKSLSNKEEVILNENKFAQNCEYFNVRDVKISPNHQFVCFAVDYKGNEEYEIKIKNIRQDKILNDVIPHTFGEVVWHQNNKGFFYVPTGENWRAKSVLYHQLGNNYEDDQLLYQEEDITFNVSITKSDTNKYLIISTSNSQENESYSLDLTTDNLDLKLFLKRKNGHKYYINDHNNNFFILTNDRGKNFRIAKAENNDLTESWRDFIACSNNRYIRSFQLYEYNMVVTSSNNINGLLDIEIINLRDNSSKHLSFPDQSYHVDVIATTYKANSVRFNYSTLSTPPTIKEYDFIKNTERVLRVETVPSGFDKNKYQVERLYADSRDGATIPISLIYRKKSFQLNNNKALYLYGYGSYGIPSSLAFKKNIFSLVDRGFTYAIAHIRGGDDLGCQWYESAKFLNKKKTFYDFIDVSTFLVKKNYVEYGNITIAGGSAGGMLVGFSANEKPELFKTVVAHVPFVDVLNTMLDETLPLTPGEYKEWGNPKYKEYYFYIKSYSPYDNVIRQNYPNFFITAGLSDPRVTYWEPAKWVAKLRAHKTDNNRILFKTNMSAGHAGKTGRYHYFKEIAEEYAFVVREGLK